ncbi:MAG: hypothetical protein CL693_19280 [Cellvibrionaceae bacterium]|nr:hypothetical protein [Cellvibrionaceae bacterium]
MKCFVLMGLSLLCFGCAVNSDSDSAQSMTRCTEPRPQMCTMDYRPVCGMSAEGQQKTYSNGCGACSNALVDSWREGACPE